MKQILLSLVFVLWGSITIAQTTKDGLSELQSILDSIPDIILAELGIDTTTQIIPDTLHLFIPNSIASDTAYARSRLDQAIELIKIGKYDYAYAKADTAKHIYQMNIGYMSKEVADCLHQMGRVFHFKGKYDHSLKLNEKIVLLKVNLLGEFHSDVASSINLIGTSYISKGEYDKALKYHQKALKIYIKAHGTNHANVGACFNNLGVSYKAKGKFDKAIGYFQKGLSVQINVLGSQHINVGISYSNLGSIFQSIGKYDEALEYYKLSLPIFINALGHNHTNVGSTFNNIGGCYNSKGEFDKAIEFTGKALDIYIKALGAEHDILGFPYNNLGNYYKSKGEYNKAIENYNKALNIRINTLGEDHDVVGTNYHNISIVYQLKGEYNKAIEYSKKALKIRINSLGPDHPDVANSYNNLGGFFDSNGKSEKAIFFLQKAIDIRINRFGLYNDEVGTSYNNLGVFYENRGEFDKAFEYLLKALEIRIKTLGLDHPSVGTSYNNLGVFYNSTKDFNSAVECLLKAIDIRIKALGQDHPNICDSYRNIGATYYIKGEYNKAIAFYKKSINVLTKSFGIIHPEVISSQYKIANIYKKLNQIDSSLFYLHQAIYGIKSQMTSDISTETKNLYQSQNIPVFESAIDVSLVKSTQDQHDSLKLKTYEYTELAKASLLQSQIKQTDALAFAGIPDFLLQKEYDLRIDINWREKQRQGLLEKGKEETDQDVLRISSIIFDLKREQEALFETLEKDYPEYYRLKYDTRTISLEDTQQKLLKDGQTMLEYFVGDSSIFIFVVRPDTFDVVQVKKDFPLDSLVKQMQSGLYGYHGQSADKRSDIVYKNSITDYSYAAQALYQRIMAPIAHLLTPDLVIIPDGVLGYVPFEALLKSKPEKLNQFGTYPYLINDHNMSYNYSATLWQEMKNKKHKKEPTKSLVAFAPFYEGSFIVLDSTINLVFDTLPDGRDTTIFQDIVSRKTYDPLPSSGIETGTVSKLYKGDYFVNSDATEQKFYDGAGDYRMVHLSTHGVADARQGDYSYLAFAEQKDSIENEFLYVRDIYNTQLNADLVFLSACETAQGELQRGEGIISLARAFAYAGAKSIITTLWQVDDTATKDISIDFYKNLKKGYTKDVALRQAKLRHINSAKSIQKHPFFWAAMIGIGDMGEVK